MNDFVERMIDAWLAVIKIIFMVGALILGIAFVVAITSMLLLLLEIL